MQKLTFKEKVYTYQIDFVGHVNNIVYIQWLENGRMRILEEMGYRIDKLAHNAGIVPILIETQIQYTRPLFLTNTVNVEMWISKLNNASAIMEFRFYNEKKELCASAQQKGLFIDQKIQRPVRMSPDHRQAFEKYLIPEN
ncbi:MAG: acyl-CoA thioesterase [Mariniphaga sp.]|nr:acyl-CoA thioesterase [Mariniphaga sp.]